MPAHSNRWLAAAALLLGLSPPAMPAADPPRSTCNAPNNPDRTIRLCTEVIHRAKAPAATLSAARRHRGIAYFFNQRYDDAIADFTELIRLSPDEEAHQLRAAAYHHRGQHHLAQADWAAAKRHRQAVAPPVRETSRPPTPPARRADPPDPDPARPAESIQQRVHRVVAENYPHMKDRPEARFADEPKADSLDFLELVMAIEDEFGVEISDRECAGLSTVAELLAYIQALPSRRAADPEPGR